MTMDRQTFPLLPKLNGANLSAQVGGYFFPGIQAVLALPEVIG
jgi:hypothetical protein